MSNKESKEKTATAQINVTVKDTDVFKDIIGLLGRIIIDERIKENIRDEIYGKLKEINDKYEKEE